MVSQVDTFIEKPCIVLNLFGPVRVKGKGACTHKPMGGAAWRSIARQIGTLFLLHFTFDFGKSGGFEHGRF